MTETEERKAREGFERWVDERIRSALSGLSLPLETRIRKLRSRVELLRERFQRLSHRMDPSKPSPGACRPGRKAGNGSRG